MKRFLLPASLLLSVSVSAQTSLPYFSGFDNAGEQTGWTEIRVGHENEFYEWQYTTAMPYSAPNCVVHNYPVGGQDLVDDWFISPEFDFTGGGMLDSLRYSFAGFGVPGAGDTIAVYLLNGSQDPDVATKTLLMDFRGGNYVGDGAWRRLDPTVIPAQSGESYIAIRYSTIVNWLDVRFDNIAISGSSAGVNENVLEQAYLYPNPSNGTVNIRLPEGMETVLLEVYDAASALVVAGETDGTTAVGLNVAPGMYTYRLTAQNGVASGKLAIR